jgi:hypothetical protein
MAKKVKAKPAAITAARPLDTTLLDQLDSKVKLAHAVAARDDDTTSARAGRLKISRRA